MAQENNIGASRLLGTNGLQQSIDSLTSTVGKMASSLNNVFSSSRSNGNGQGSPWNSNSNRPSTGNGGGSTFSGGGTFNSNGRGNGGHLPSTTGSRIAGGLSAAATLASGFTNYGNTHMSDMMQQNYFGVQAAMAGGGGGVNTAINSVWRNNNAALNSNDAARSGYINQFTFGNATFNGQSNPAFIAGQRMANGVGYANPTFGAAAAATTLQQTYSARANQMAQAFGLGPTIGQYGKKTDISTVAQAIYNRTFNTGRPVTLQGFNASLQQGGSLSHNLNAIGSAMGFSSTTIQEYQGLLQGQQTAMSNGMSASTYYNLLGKAGNNDKSAMAALGKVGIGKSTFEAQRNLNSTTMGNQADINESMATAFTKTTNAVNSLTKSIDALMKSSGLNSLIGTGAGVLSPLSNAAGGLSNGFSTGLGIMGAMRLFGRGVGASGGVPMGMRGAGGAYNITSMTGGSALSTEAAMTAALPAFMTGAAALLAGNQLNKTAAARTNSTQKDFVSTNFFSWELKNPKATQAQKDAEKANLTAQWQANHSGSAGTSGGGSNGTPGGGGTGVAHGGANAASVIGFAETQLGVPYGWGMENPGRAFDCSGLTQWAYGKAGVSIPRVAADQQKSGTQVPTNATQPGDLLFAGNPAHHVVMSIGGGKVIEAPHTGAKVRIRSFSPNEFTSASRIVGSVGNMGSLLNQNSAPNQNTLNNQQALSGGDIGAFGGTSEAAIIAAALSGVGSGLGVQAQSASGTSGTSALGSSVGTITPTGSGKSGLQAYAKALLAKYGWANQWNSFNALEMSEAGWDLHATNPTSGAYGLPQALPASKMSSAGADWKTNGNTQLAWMMGYIKDRYGSPDNAWSFHQKNNWYASGAWNLDQDQTAQVHKGEMILPAKQAETVRSAITNAITNSSSRTGSAGASISIGDINVTLPSTYSGGMQETKQIGKIIANTITENLRIEGLKVGQ